MPESRRTQLRLAVPLSMLALAAACAGPPRELIESARIRNLRRLGPPEPTPDLEVERDPDTGAPTVERGYLDMPGGTRLNHGAHRTWYEDGAPATLRSFDRGRPSGIWWTWWSNGTLRSAYRFDPDEATTMVWWHANGLLAAKGLARNGTRTGPWRFWHENGEPRSEGSFVGGERDGDWTYFDAAGEWTERGRYARGVRVGQWEFRAAAGR